MRMPDPRLRASQASRPSRRRPACGITGPVALERSIRPITNASGRRRTLLDVVLTLTDAVGRCSLPVPDLYYGLSLGHSQRRPCLNHSHRIGRCDRREIDCPAAPKRSAEAPSHSLRLLRSDDHRAELGAAGFCDVTIETGESRGSSPYEAANSFFRGTNESNEIEARVSGLPPWPSSDRSSQCPRSLPTGRFCSSQSR
jgi:hypothetical protein